MRGLKSELFSSPSSRDGKKSLKEGQKQILRYLTLTGDQDGGESATIDDVNLFQSFVFFRAH